MFLKKTKFNKKQKNNKHLKSDGLLTGMEKISAEIKILNKDFIPRDALLEEVWPDIIVNREDYKSLNYKYPTKKMVLESFSAAEFLNNYLPEGMARPVFYGLRELFKKNNINGPYLHKLLEDVIIFVRRLTRCRDFDDYHEAIIIFLKLRNSGPLVTANNILKVWTYFQKLFSQIPQSAESLFSSVRSYMDKFDEVKESHIYKKLYKFLMYLLSFSIFDKIGISFSTFNYTTIEAEALRKKYHMGVDFIHTMLDTCLFLCERGVQCIKTGTMDPIFHSGNKYDEWSQTAHKLKREAIFLSNPEPHGIDRFQFLADLDEAIESGAAILKHAMIIGGLEKRCVQSLLADLQLVKSNELTKRSAMKTRKPPFSIMLFGGSNIGKTMLRSLLFHHYAKINNLPNGEEFMYHRNPIDKYWTLFNSMQWCVVLDDIANYNPNQCVGVDPTLSEIIQINNGVPLVPIQADLADKGRTPLNCKLLIATSNVEDLNAHAYFADPLAVQRRLPWVVHVRPKPEYAKNSVMLDGSKVPELEPGEYPDFWYFTVKKVVPADSNIVNQRAVLEIVAEFNNVYDFVAWFSHEVKFYDDLQDKSAQCHKVMVDVEVCPRCYVPQSHCRCYRLESMNDLMNTTINANNVSNITNYLSNEQTYFDLFITMFGAMVWYILVNLYLHTPLFRWPTNRAFGCERVEEYLVSRIQRFDLTRWFMRRLGEMVQRKIGKYKVAIQLAAAITAIYSIYKMYFCFKRTFLDKKDFIPEMADPETLIRVSEAIGEKPKAKKEEPNNVWYKDNYVTTTFDVGLHARSIKGISDEALIALLFKNCVAIRSYFKDELGKETSRPGKGVCVAKHLYMFNNHTLPTNTTFALQLFYSNSKDGVGPNVLLRIKQKDVIRYPERDLAFINITNVPPKKDIIALFSKESLRGNMKGFYLGRGHYGDMIFEEVHNINFVPQLKNKYLDSSVDSWFGKANSPTGNGFCGTMMVGRSYYGPIILGIHYLGEDTSVNAPPHKLGEPYEVLATKVTVEFLQEVVKLVDPIIVEPNCPALNSTSTNIVLGELNIKSPIRYIPQGTANVYGSFIGYRNRNTSKVMETPICEAMKRRGYVIRFGPPVMSGWEPWRVALLPMLDKQALMDNDKLKICKEAFINDILTALTDEDLSNIQIYDNFTALNGADGVSYVDKMDRNTSAGYPWRKSKRYFLRAIPPQHGLQEPVEAIEEIMDRVDDIISKYKEGQRYCPIFSAHLKDECVSFAKIKAKKTRVFAGAPMDWSIVVRKYCLSLVRLMQKKRYVFECGPGLIAQSTQWQDLKNYLCTFGKSTMVCGDFKDFDKNMSAQVILAAFDVIIAISKAAGFDEEAILAINCIAEDTAFPFIDFNGDLIEFFGVNPSGHPLTVIINGIAHALYMRYAYLELNPNKTASDFKEHVKLITYGDDGVMGVSPSIPWFNHTTVQESLGQVGVTYTMADKNAISVPYISFDQVSFLKRTWRYDEDVGAFLCPLDHDSIERSLMTCVESKETAEKQIMDIIHTSIREYFWYGKATFEKRRNMLIEVVDECNLQPYIVESSFPTWQQLYTEFWDASNKKSLDDVKIPLHLD